MTEWHGKVITKKLRMTGHNFNKLLKELGAREHTEIVKDNEDRVTVLFNGKKLLTSQKGIGNVGRIVQSVEGLIITA